MTHSATLYKDKRRDGLQVNKQRRSELALRIREMKMIKVFKV